MDNNENIVQNSPIPPQEQPIQEPRTPSSMGALIGIIIVIAIIILGGMYFWGQRVDQKENIIEKDTATQSLQNQGTSDDLAAIETDVNSTQLDNLDSELGSIDTELETAGF
ncbi:MAG: hypothetical protein AAB706_00195 [Patescibacteria group bacterium]